MKSERLPTLAGNIAKYTAENKWLIDALEGCPYHSSFMVNMMGILQRQSLESLSDKCQIVLREIYVKAIGGDAQHRQASIDFFNSKAGRCQV